MKCFQTLVAIVLFSLPMFGQSTASEEFGIIQNAFQKDKKELVGLALKLQGAQADSFWLVYDEYEAKRMALGTDRFKIIKDYAMQYSALTDEQAGALAQRAIANDKATVDLKKSYFKKFSKAAGAKNAAKFYQVDAYIDLLVKQETMDSIPFIDEISAKK